MRRGFASLILILLVILMVVAAIFGQKSLTAIFKQNINLRPGILDKFANWNNYQNKTYGFSIRYPKNWYVKEYQDYAANFYDANPNEATPGAIKVRFLRSAEKVDIGHFEKIYKTDEGVEIRELLDVKSIITKIRNLEIEGFMAVEYEINRYFSALEGPKTEYSHVYEINKNGVVLRFVSSATTREEQQTIDPIFRKMMSKLTNFI